VASGKLVFLSLETAFEKKVPSSGLPVDESIFTTSFEVQPQAGQRRYLVLDAPLLIERTQR
jgi:hypothetical protein